ncbi:hypothetical protein ACFLZ2_05780 [Candidatus Margulisiibacteriota bacterium]
MGISIGQSSLLAYPRFQPGFNPRTAIPKNYSLDMAEKALPAAEYPYLNLRGLAGVEGLSVQITTNLEERSGHTYHDFFVNYKRASYLRPGRIDLYENTGSSGLMIFTLYPSLPQSPVLGKDLGKTLLFLILTRGNSFTGKRVDILGTTRYGYDMAISMTHFSQEMQNAGEGLYRRVFLSVPQLSAEQLTAVEWYWTNILHCPAV